MAIIDGYSAVLDLKPAQTPQINVAELPATGTKAPNAVPPIDATKTSNRFTQEAINLRQRGIQQNAAEITEPSVNAQPSEEILSARLEVAPDIDANQARNRYEQTSGGPANLPPDYQQVAIDA